MGDNSVMEYLNKISGWYFQYNYDYIWLKTMIEKAGFSGKGDGTLITGSSHGLNAIWELAWDNAINCSMHSQDIYYDFKCAKAAIEGGGRFRRCFIVMGYYIPFQDVSLSTSVREDVVSNVYYPLFKDAHNWKNIKETDLWEFMPQAGELIRARSEEYGRDRILEEGTYYSKYVNRTPFFDFSGKDWKDLDEEDKDRYGRERATSHNKIFVHKESYRENVEILRDYIHLLHLNEVLPAVIITPFTKEYCRYVNGDMKAAVLDMLNKIDEEVHFIDFNEIDGFEEEYFIDTDHMSEMGAKKFSVLLSEVFGR